MAPEADPTNLQGLLQEVVRELRLGCEGAAGDRMRVFLEQMAAWLAGQSAEGYLDQERLLSLLKSLLSAQERADALALADGLEFELSPLLGDS